MYLKQSIVDRGEFPSLFRSHSDCQREGGERLKTCVQIHRSEKLFVRGWVNLIHALVLLLRLVLADTCLTRFIYLFSPLCIWTE